jgi:hypothetical protein
MPLRKFRSVEEMNVCAGDAAGNVASRLRELITMVSGVVPYVSRRGVQKFRSIEEANEARLQCEIERARFLRERMRAKDS